MTLLFFSDLGKANKVGFNFSAELGEAHDVDFNIFNGIGEEIDFSCLDELHDVFLFFSGVDAVRFPEIFGIV